MNDTPSLRARQLRAARLAAIQSVYSHRMVGHDPAALIHHFVESGKIAPLQYDDGDEDLTYDPNQPDALDADFPLFKKLVQDTIASWDALEQALEAALQQVQFDGYLPKREALLFCVIMVGLSELSRANEAHKIRLINEYVSLASSFYSDKEAGLVNHFLESYSKTL